MFLILILAGVIGTFLIYASFENTYQKALFSGALIAVLAAIASLIIHRIVGRPIDELARIVSEYEQGTLERHRPVSGTDEIGRLSDTLNRMAARLDEKIRAISEQRNEQEAVFQSMIEGVLAVDIRERLININNAACGMIGLDKSQVIGRFMQEIIRNAHLQRFISGALAGFEEQEVELPFQSGSINFVRANASVLRGSDGRKLGALIVLNDITRLKQLENIRRDFVANVSHELRTPITSIKGFVETLRHGALQNRDDAERFLGIIARQTDRLNSIIEDLLSLSRIEEGAEKMQIPLENAGVNKILGAAVQACEHWARDREIRLVLKCPEGLRANINAQLLEQAIINLIDNAIKYSDNGKIVEITGSRADNGVVLAVRDQGCGIEKHHLPRLFERFYRADRARSRELGGTGLGLAIVKHIALAHGGNVGVESVPGQGSIFRIFLPLPFYAAGEAIS